MTPIGQTLDDFQNLIQVNFPSSLIDYDKMKETQLKKEILEGKDKQQELLQQILANAGNATVQTNKQYVEDILGKYGLDIKGLLFQCDQKMQQQIIESLDQEDREKLHEEIKQFDLNEINQQEEQQK